MNESYKQVRKENLQPYTWGGACLAWSLQQSDNVIIKEEMMPPGTSEHLHFHRITEQFFYILSGDAHFFTNGKEFDITSGEGVSIFAGCPHKISNQTENDLRFLVISAPGNPNDRVEVE